MQFRKINNQAVMAVSSDKSVTLWQPGGGSLALFPGTVVNVPTGWKLMTKEGEAALTEIAKDLAQAGCVLTWPTAITDHDGELVVTILNRSSFVVTLEPMTPICRLLAVQVAATKIEASESPAHDNEPVIADRMIAAAKKVGGRGKR